MNKLIKSISKVCAFLFCMFITSMGVSAEKVLKVVVLGSSTAEGTGATAGQGWVARYTAYLKSINVNSELINLGKGGYTTYEIMPNGNSVAGKRAPDTDRNITKALLYSPDVIIVNMPSNDVAAGYLASEVMANYAAIKLIAETAGAQIFFTTTQPRNMGFEQNQQQIAIKEATIATYPDRYIDFWSGIAEQDGTIKSEYNYDGIHLNDAGHEILYNRVVETSSIMTFAKPSVTPGSYSETGRLLIDFGGTSTISTGNWNNVTGARQVGVTYAVSLKNSINEKTPFKIYVHKAFNEVNYEGVNSGVNILDYPNSAANDSFFGNGRVEFNGVIATMAGVTLDNLDMDKLYSLTFFAGRRGVADNRQTKYTVKGRTTQEVILNTTNNTSTVLVNNMEPDNEGKIVIDVTYGNDNNSANWFYYLGVLDIEYKPKTTPVDLVNFNLSSEADYVNVSWTTSSEVNDSHFEIYKSGSNNKFELMSSVPTSSASGYNTYSYTDKNPFTGINYYFLRQVDKDGVYKDYDVKSVNFNNIITNTSYAYIQKGTNNLMIYGHGNEEDRAQIVEVKVISIDGRLLAKKNVTFTEGVNDIEITSLESKGVYVITVKKSNKLSTYKILY
ncbi:GDSL-type esterase/lipase family protein [Pseudopedobacter beijingensis]|uniref:GDSL-type esterase/lipase family protein n=1 Tax=Pseudopedobacter beijingensis TaxID=1207056 RepID=A0ABW4IGS7_9SPHI